ncbi:MAG: isopentenyl-diphosphate Delta-isomerase [Flavisolibacter sp.]
MSTSEVILVNEKDEPIGMMDKMEAHKSGLLHRAFSVFIFDSKGRMLLQQRAAQKYHGALLWTNACCSHPYPGESTINAAHRRLKEEMGFSVKLEEIFSFSYHAEVENGLTEHEFDHVFAGEYDGAIKLNLQEVSACKYLSLDEVSTALKNEPARFTSWFKIAFPMIIEWWERNYINSGHQKNKS